MIKPTEEFLKIFKETDGALSVSESIAIMNISAQAPVNGRNYEYGSYYGKSGMSAMYGLLTPSINLVDPIYIGSENKICQTVFDTLRSAPTNKPSTNREINLTGGYSTDVIEKNNDYAYVFIDSGSHQDGLPMQEVKLLENRMVPGGIIAFHDFRSQFSEVEEAYNYLLSTGKYEEIPINWKEITDYVDENNLEEGNKSWHHTELKNPCFVGALKRK